MSDVSKLADTKVMRIIEDEKDMFFTILNSFFMERFEYKRPPSDITPGSYIFDARRKKFRIYIRLHSVAETGGAKTVEIAQIQFLEIRQGHATALLRFISNISDRFNLQNIIIEQANAHSSLFAKSLGFSKSDGNNWIIDTLHLKKKLQSNT